MGDYLNREYVDRKCLVTTSNAGVLICLFVHCLQKIIDNYTLSVMSRLRTFSKSFFSNYHRCSWAGVAYQSSRDNVKTCGVELLRFARSSLGMLLVVLTRRLYLLEKCWKTLLGNTPQEKCEWQALEKTNQVSTIKNALNDNKVM